MQLKKTGVIAVRPRSRSGGNAKTACHILSKLQSQMRLGTELLQMYDYGSPVSH